MAIGRHQSVEESSKTDSYKLSNVLQEALEMPDTKKDFRA